MSTNPNGPLYFVEDNCLAEFEKTVINIAQRRVVAFLWKNGERSLAEITKETQISLNALAAVYLGLAPANVIERTKDGLRLTPSGRLWVIANRKFLFMRPAKLAYQSALPIEFKVTTSSRGTLPRTYRL